MSMTRLQTCLEKNAIAHRWTEILIFNRTFCYYQKSFYIRALQLGNCAAKVVPTPAGVHENLLYNS